MTPLESAKKHANMRNAAPDMYEALKNMESRLGALQAFYVTNVGPDYSEVKKVSDEAAAVCAALAKAEGHKC